MWAVWPAWYDPNSVDWVVKLHTNLLKQGIILEIWVDWTQISRGHKLARGMGALRPPLGSRGNAPVWGPGGQSQKRI